MPKLILHVEDRDLLQDLVDSALCGVVDGAVSFRTRHPDGQWLDIEATARGFSTALGEPRLVAVLRDVTQRERDRRILERQISGEQRIAELSRFFMDIEPGSTQQATQDKFAVAAELAGELIREPRNVKAYLSVRKSHWRPLKVGLEKVSGVSVVRMASLIVSAAWNWPFWDDEITTRSNQLR